MSVIHGKWSVEDIRKVIRNLDEKTGLHGADLRIYLGKRLENGSVLGTYFRGYGDSRMYRSFSFSQAYFDNNEFKDLAVIDVVTHEYAHFVVDELDLKAVFQDDDAHGIAWKTVCGLLNCCQEQYYCSRNFRLTTEAGLRRAIACENIPSADISEQLGRWGKDLPSLATRERYERELIRKYSKVRVFAVNDRVHHSKFGQGLVLDTMPDLNKQRLFVRFDNGETRFVQNRQVYKVVNGQIKKPRSKAR